MDLQTITEAISKLEDVTSKLRDANTSLSSRPPSQQSLNEIQQWISSANNSIAVTNHSILLMDETTQDQNYVKANIAFGAAVASFIAAEQEVTSKLPAAPSHVGVTIPESFIQTPAATTYDNAPPPSYAAVMTEAPISQQPTAPPVSAQPATDQQPIVETRTIYVKAEEEECQPYYRCTRWRFLFYAIVTLAAIIILIVGKSKGPTARVKPTESPVIPYMDDWAREYLRTVKVPEFNFFPTPAISTT